MIDRIDERAISLQVLYWPSEFTPALLAPEVLAPTAVMMDSSADSPPTFAEPCCSNIQPNAKSGRHGGLNSPEEPDSRPIHRQPKMGEHRDSQCPHSSRSITCSRQADRAAEPSAGRLCESPRVLRPHSGRSSTTRQDVRGRGRRLIQTAAILDR